MKVLVLASLRRDQKSMILDTVGKRNVKVLTEQPPARTMPPPRGIAKVVVWTRFTSHAILNAAEHRYGKAKVVLVNSGFEELLRVVVKSVEPIRVY